MGKINQRRPTWGKWLFGNKRKRSERKREPPLEVSRVRNGAKGIRNSRRFKRRMVSESWIAAMCPPGYAPTWLCAHLAAIKTAKCPSRGKRLLSSSKLQNARAVHDLKPDRWQTIRKTSNLRHSVTRKRDIASNTHVTSEQKGFCPQPVKLHLLWDQN